MSIVPTFLTGTAARRWSRRLAALDATPARLQVMLATHLLAALVFWLLLTLSVADLRETVQVIGQDTVPSIVAAERLRTRLAVMDADAAKAFLVDGDAATGAWARFNDAIPILADDLVQLAQDITFGEEERQPLRGITADMLSYAGMVGEARSLGRPAAIQRLEAASRLLHERILTAATAIDEANFRQLNRSVARHDRSELIDLGEILTALVLLGVALLHTQIFLKRHAHRLINPPLYGATVLLACFAVWAGYSHILTHAALVDAKLETIDSMHALWRARAAASDADGDQARYLLASGDPAGQARYARHFREKAALLVGTTMQQAQAEARQDYPSFDGHLGDALRLSGLPGEKAATLETLDDWGRYLALADQIRGLEAEGRHDQAVALALGNADTQSGGSFARFDAALDHARAINRQVFDTTIAEAFERLAELRYVVPALAVLIVVLAFVGLQPRIDEYRL